MSKKTDQIKFMQAMFPNAKFVECKYIEEGQRIADDSKTIDHISQEEKKVSLTEQWKKGELEDGLYYCKLACFNYKPAISKCKAGRIGLASFSKNEEVLAPVPTWEEYLESESHCAVYSDVNKWLKEENDKLKQLIKEWIHYYPIVLYEYEDTLKTKDIIELYDRTREVLDDNNTLEISEENQRLKELLDSVLQTNKAMVKKFREIELTLIMCRKWIKGYNIFGEKENKLKDRILTQIDEALK